MQLGGGLAGTVVKVGKGLQAKGEENKEGNYYAGDEDPAAPVVPS